MAQKSRYILVINPGSTSTKLAVFSEETQVFSKTARHAAEELSKCGSTMQQLQLRKDAVLAALAEWDLHEGRFAAVIGRGGLLKPLKSGTYSINQCMLQDLSNSRYGEHASNLGALIAHEIASRGSIPAYITDPVVVDEMDEIARITGVPEIKRKSIFHALNHKAVGRRAAKALGKDYMEANLVIAHLGGGITVAAHRLGSVVDVNDGLFGDGPMSAERAGRLPTGPLIDMCFSGSLTLKDVKRKLVGFGGLAAYFGTNDAVEIEKRIASGDSNAELVYKACAYQVSKDIASCCAVLEGEVDAIILTGGLAHSDLLTGWIAKRVGFLAKIMVFPGEDEMLAMAEAACRVLRGEEQVLEYI